MKYNDNDSELLYLVSEENEDAKEIFYEKYRGIIEMVAKKYMPFAKTSGIELNDLIQEGMLGLSQAIDSFKEKKDVQFSTFANLCIKRSIISYVRKNTNTKNKSLNNSLSMDTTLNSNGKPLLELIQDDNNINPEDIYISIENNKELMKKITEHLSNNEREVFLLRIRGFSYQEISLLLNITKKSAERSMERVRSKLEKLQEDID